MFGIPKTGTFAYIPHKRIVQRIFGIRHFIQASHSTVCKAFVHIGHIYSVAAAFLML